MHAVLPLRWRRDGLRVRCGSFASELIRFGVPACPPWPHGDHSTAEVVCRLSAAGSTDRHNTAVGKVMPLRQTFSIRITFLPLYRTIYLISRPRDRGVSAASRTWGGERWPGNDVSPEMRRSGPAVQAAYVPARQPRATGPRDGGCRRPVTGLAGSDLGLQRWIGVSSARDRLKGQSTGGDAEQT
jgi:hypothetical protein